MDARSRRVAAAALAALLRICGTTSRSRPEEAMSPKSTTVLGFCWSWLQALLLDVLLACRVTSPQTRTTDAPIIIDPQTINRPSKGRRALPAPPKASAARPRSTQQGGRLTRIKTGDPHSAAARAPSAGRERRRHVETATATIGLPTVSACRVVGGSSVPGRVRGEDERLSSLGLCDDEERVVASNHDGRQMVAEGPIPWAAAV